jgi:TnsA endonuclease-like protein
MKQALAIPNIEIRFPTDGKVRIREVIRRSNSQKSGKYPGIKAGRMMHSESPHEMNAMRLLDACPFVLEFHEQPCEILYYIEGERHRHYPDLLVIGHDWKELWEVKSLEDASDPFVAARTKKLSAQLPQYGFTYRMILAENLGGIRLSNARQLLKLGSQPVPSLERERIRQLFMAYETLSWESLHLDDSHPGLLRHCARLILEGRLTFDVSQPLVETTPIYWALNQDMKGAISWASLISTKA